MMMLVTLVPMFAPIIIGMAVRTGAPADTSPTMMEVEVEEDCTRTVTRTPIINPTTGFFKRSEFEKRAPMFFPPSMRKESERQERGPRILAKVMVMSLKRRDLPGAGVFIVEC